LLLYIHYAAISTSIQLFVGLVFTSVHILVTSGSTLDQAIMLGSLIETVNCCPVTSTSTLGTALTLPKVVVSSCPVTSTGVLRSISAFPKLEDNSIPVGKAFASASTTTEATAVSNSCSAPAIILTFPSTRIA
jgi:hypothetical protein